MSGPSSPVVRTLGLTRRFGHRTAVDRLELSVAPGESLALLGANGAGKSTALRMIGLTLRPHAGHVELFGSRANPRDRSLRARIGIVGQALQLYEALSCFENLKLFSVLYGVADPTGCAEQALDSLGLSARAADPVSTLSRGLAQRLAIARALIHEPELVLLDEPFTGLDARVAAWLDRRIAGLREAGRTVIWVTHDLERALAASDRWALLGRGRLVDGDTAAGWTAASLRGRCFPEEPAPS